MGLSGLWLNVKGREKSGIVESEEIATLKYRLGGRLTLLTDPATEKRVIRRVFDRDRIYRGAFEHNAPDLVIGYESGYRSSWQTVLGAAPESLFDDNRQKWSGDHIVDPALVPGIFMTNRAVAEQGASIQDIAPTVLAQFGIEEHGMDGTALTLNRAQ